MIFKNLNIFELPATITKAGLEAYLAQFPFEPCKPSQESSAGFTPLFGSFERVASVNGCHLFCLKVEEKVIPPAAVKSEYKRLKLDREAFLGRRLNQTERDDLNSATRAELCKKAFCKPADLWAYIDTEAKILVVNTTSPKNAEGLVLSMRGCFPDVRIEPLRTEIDIRKKLTEWLMSGVAAEPFSLGEKCEISDGLGIIRYKDRTLQDDQLRKYLSEGLGAETLSLAVEGEMKFVFTCDYVFKEFSIDIKVFEEAERSNSGIDFKPLLELSVMSRLVRKLISSMSNALKIDY
ncbi:recombination-associated protein RdgC [Pseudomonas putida]|uniref:Recombination-associated protein RdgC n=1 Tax=Pseudomonas putida TaxID=303 RepID=A0A8I1JIF5_PSEPU|nr:recombination-associated protein RdgC [Pseudomonas putida]MBI6882923.1 recombination-associated protein RdgC [Pseudomonas putida]